eukprot:m.87120 g.87120  ORF g.87120 m.87120 type:complete len:265 (+) comp14767_c0_seq133:2334-3128(+)
MQTLAYAMASWQVGQLLSYTTSSRTLLQPISSTAQPSQASLLCVRTHSSNTSSHSITTLPRLRLTRGQLVDKLQAEFPQEPQAAVVAALAGFNDAYEPTRRLFASLQQATSHLGPARVPPHLAQKPEAAKLLRERGRLQQCIRPLRQQERDHPEAKQVYESVCAAYTEAIRNKTKDLERVANDAPPADLVLKRDMPVDEAVQRVQALLEDRLAAILNGAKVMVRVDKGPIIRAIIADLEGSIYDIDEVHSGLLIKHDQHGIAHG